MAMLLRNPSLLNTAHSNSANSFSSMSVNFGNSCSNLQNSCRQARFLPLNSLNQYRAAKTANSSRELGIQHRRSKNEMKIGVNSGLIHRKLVVKASEGEENTTSGGRTFLSFEEAGLVELSGLSTHERFLCRLTISSLNLLRVIAEQEGCEIEELNAGRVCDWFLKDKLKREQDIGSAVLQWEEDTDDFQF